MKTVTELLMYIFFIEQKNITNKNQPKHIIKGNMYVSTREPHVMLKCFAWISIGV